MFFMTVPQLIWNIFYYLPKFSSVPLLLISSLHPQPLATIDQTLVSIVLSFPECYINGIMKNIDIYVWFLSLSPMPLRLIHGIVCTSSSFIFIAE